MNRSPITLADVQQLAATIARFSNAGFVGIMPPVGGRVLTSDELLRKLYDVPPGRTVDLCGVLFFRAVDGSPRLVELNPTGPARRVIELSPPALASPLG